MDLDTMEYMFMIQNVLTTSKYIRCIERRVQTIQYNDAN